MKVAQLARNFQLSLNLNIRSCMFSSSNEFRPVQTIIYSTYACKDPFWYHLRFIGRSLTWFLTLRKHFGHLIITCVYFPYTIILDLTFWYRSFIFNSNKSTTWCNSFSVYYPDVCLQWSGRPARPRTQHDCHHDTKEKPEAAIAVIELLMMGGKTPETCWAVNKRQDNKLKNCCIRLVICLNCTMMHGLTNFKFYI